MRGDYLVKKECSGKGGGTRLQVVFMCVYIYIYVCVCVCLCFHNEGHDSV
jgi:hypothetical protein